MLIELIIGGIVAGLIGAAIILTIITSSVVIECAKEWWGARTNIVVVDPSTSAELERIAARKGSRRHKRFIYNKSIGESKMVESNSISGEVSYRKRVELYVS